MSETAMQLDRLTVQTEYLDMAVAEVFELMMGVVCAPAAVGPELEAGTAVGVTAIVGLAGTLNGACVLRMQQPVAIHMAGLMVGSPLNAFDRTVKDALGEACNMLAGAWKGKLEGFSSTCMLSVPAVISGSNYELNLPLPAFHLERTYVFERNFFHFQITCAGL